MSTHWVAARTPTWLCILRRSHCTCPKRRLDNIYSALPVSAYALFFRDTQAAIKGQNPNASFGEVSKIVASMWDALDADSKNVSFLKMLLAKLFESTGTGQMIVLTRKAEEIKP
ncbi:TOX high mobility group box member 4 [Polyplax serrata]|uniref:TOX high mobility group box member 4 n=1 Tax=Polyplax serrata TaxID=468196 RepID=A0ABR1BAV3_POLSC